MDKITIDLKKCSGIDNLYSALTEAYMRVPVRHRHAISALIHELAPIVSKQDEAGLAAYMNYEAGAK